jgi:hypothetical protein
MMKFMRVVPGAKLSNLLNNMLSNRFFQVFLELELELLQYTLDKFISSIHGGNTSLGKSSSSKPITKP